MKPAAGCSRAWTLSAAHPPGRRVVPWPGPTPLDGSYGQTAGPPRADSTPARWRARSAVSTRAQVYARAPTPRHPPVASGARWSGGAVGRPAPASPGLSTARLSAVPRAVPRSAAFVTHLRATFARSPGPLIPPHGGQPATPTRRGGVRRFGVYRVGAYSLTGWRATLGASRRCNRWGPRPRPTPRGAGALPCLTAWVPFGADHGASTATAERGAPKARRSEGQTRWGTTGTPRLARTVKGQHRDS